MANIVGEMHLDNAEIIDNKDLSIEDKIRIRLQELQDIRVKVVEALKAQQEKSLGPIDAVIAELTDLLPKEEK